ncbi:MAG: PAS domain S-box protein [Desulfomonilaceae bacterium]
MTTVTDSENKISELRRRAESALVEKAGDASDISALSPEDVQKLVHELQVHQIELEMQNEELRQTQLALEASRDNFSELYDFAPVGYVTLNGKGLILEGNLTAVRLLGVARQSFIKKPFSRFVSQEFGDPFYLYLKQVFETQSKQTCEIKLARKDGTEFYVQLESVAVQDENGHFNRCRTVLSDITERKRTEENLRNSEARLWDLYDNAPNAYFSVGTDGLIRKCNKGAEELLAYPREMLEGKRVFDLYVDGQEGKEKAAKVFQKFMSGEQVTNEELQMQKASGSPIWISLSVNALRDADGKIVESRSTVVNINERKRAEKALRESEERFRKIFEQGPLGVAILDLDYRWVSVNAKLCEMVGYTEQELTKLTFVDITHPDDIEADIEQSNKLLFGQIPEHKMVKRYIKKNGETLWIGLTGTLIRDEQGEPIYFLAMIEDLTDRKKAEEERERLRRQLLQAQKMEAIGTLTGGIAHDFNNLLTIMNGYTEMILMDKTEDDPIYEDLKKILATGLKGADMVQRLLSFTKQAATKPEHMDLNHRIDETKKLMNRTFPKTIEIETNLPDDLGMVNADAGQMDQLLMNLCVNARDAMPDGGRLRIETRNTTVDEDYCRLHVGATPGRYVLVEVSDTGTGMIRETMDRVFDPFFTTKGWDFKKGTGLGLSVAKGIVEQHGGWINCESEPGRGTTFKVYFPVIEEPLAVRKLDPVAETVTGTGKILLVDDEEYVRDLGKRILERAGYTVITAANGKEALDIYAREQSNIALVVLDLIMPQMEGKQCLEELLKINPDVKVIVSTGHSLDARESLLLRALVRGFVNKPYEVRQMVQAMREVLGLGGPTGRPVTC